MDVEDKIRDTLVDALKSYFKSDQAGNLNTDDDSGLEMAENTDGNAEISYDNEDEEVSAPIDAPNRDNQTDQDDTEIDNYQNVELSNLFMFPETNAPHKTFSFGFKMNMNNSQSGIKMPEEIDPKIMEDFMNFMGMLGVSPDDIAETLEQMANLDLTKIVEEENNPMKNIAVQDDLFHDIFDTEGELSVIVEVPGFEKEDIELNVSNSEIDVNGTIIALPSPINPDKVKAKLNNGILEINLEKL